MELVYETSSSIYCTNVPANIFRKKIEEVRAVLPFLNP